MVLTIAFSCLYQREQSRLLREIMRPYAKMLLNMHDSLSLNGNSCRMFEFLGKREAAA
jgi:hypothetical protein